MKTKQDACDALNLYGKIAVADKALASLAEVSLTDTLHIEVNGAYVLNDAPAGFVVCVAIRRELEAYWTDRRARLQEELQQKGFE